MLPNHLNFFFFKLLECFIKLNMHAKISNQILKNSRMKSLVANVIHFQPVLIIKTLNKPV